MNTIEYLEKEIKDVDKELIKVDEQLAKWKNTKLQLHKKKASLKKSIDKLKSDSLARVDWEGNTYEWSEDVKRILKNVFNIESFRPKQLSAINLTLSGHHALVVMPTGGGKSLCYQLPALVRLGITVVISPLVSQMEHQVRSLTNKNIAAMLVTSTSSKEQTKAALDALEDEDTQVKLLYVTPEILVESKQFMANLQKCYADRRLQRIAIHEVHCCSQRGHDFRLDYKNLGILSNLFPNVPILGLTATVTAHVLADAQKILNIGVCLVIKSTLINRPNLYYKIIDKPTSPEVCVNMIEILLKERYRGKSGIIYTNSIKESEYVATRLRWRGLEVFFYHAEMNADFSSEVYLQWHENYYQALVTTVTFGIGIDKPDVRFVIHYTMSRSMENYYHECLRAGRDGNPAECITLYRMQDIFKVSSKVISSGGKLDHLYGMVKYCLNETFCRRQLIAEHFDEDWGDADCNNMCDVCSTNTLSQEISLEPHCETISSIIDNADKQDTKLTAYKLLDAWFQRGPDNLRHKGKKPTFSRTTGEDMIAFLLVQGYLVEDFHFFTANSTVSYIKKGPNMKSIDDANFTLKMQARKITTYKNDEFFKNGREEGIESKRRKSSSSSSSSSSSIIFVPKKSKIVVIEDDDD